MRSYTVQIACSNDEAVDYCEWLKQKEHKASVSSDDANYIDGVCTNDDIDANLISNQLWNAYCNN